MIAVPPLKRCWTIHIVNAHEVAGVVVCVTIFDPAIEAFIFIQVIVIADYFLWDIVFIQELTPVIIGYRLHLHYSLPS